MDIGRCCLAVVARLLRFRVDRRLSRFQESWLVPLFRREGGRGRNLTDGLLSSASTADNGSPDRKTIKGDGEREGETYREGLWMSMPADSKIQCVSDASCLCLIYPTQEISSEEGNIIQIHATQFHPPNLQFIEKSDNAMWIRV